MEIQIPKSDFPQETIYYYISINSNTMKLSDLNKDNYIIKSSSMDDKETILSNLADIHVKLQLKREFLPILHEIMK